MDLKRLLNSSWLYRAVLMTWIISAVIMMFLLSKIDSIVNVELYKNGLQFSHDWADPYWTYLNLNYIALGVPVALSLVTIAVGFTGEIKKVAERTKGSTGKIKGVAERFTVGIRKGAKISTGELRKGVKKAIGFTGEIKKGVKRAIELTGGIKKGVKRTIRQPEPQPIASQKQELEENISINNNKALKEPKKPSNAEISCPNCKKTFITPMVMLDFQGGKSRLVNVCPYCDHVLGSTENEESSEIDAQIADLDEKLTH